MAESTRVRLFCITVRTWEHELVSRSYSPASSVAASKRILPMWFTDPIYQRLYQVEEFIIRHSEPFPPYNVRLFPIYSKDDLEKFERKIFDPFREPIGSIIDQWDARAAAELQKVKGGTSVQLVGFGRGVPPGIYRSGWGYEIRLDSVSNPTILPMRDLLGEFYPTAYGNAPA